MMTVDLWHSVILHDLGQFMSPRVPSSWYCFKHILFTTAYEWDWATGYASFYMYKASIQ
jgi:hypothetical protein